MVAEPLSGWYLRTGSARDARFAVVSSGALGWSKIPDHATRFVSKAEAAVMQMELVAEHGITVALISDCPKARQQDDAKRMHAETLA